VESEIITKEKSHTNLQDEKMHWYVLTTKPKFEKKVNQGLNKVNIISYLPLQKRLRVWNDRKKWVETPLFPSYIFVKIDERERNDVFGVPGIVRYISQCGKASILKEEEMERIERLCSYLGEVEIERRKIQVGEEVQIISGHFRGMKGFVVSSKGKCRCCISIPGLDSYASIEIDQEEIQKVI
jgi:transcription antitermination factor NusG